MSSVRSHSEQSPPGIPIPSANPVLLAIIDIHILFGLVAIMKVAIPRMRPLE